MALIREILPGRPRLNMVVENLLDMNRLESGMLRLDLQDHHIRDLIASVLASLETELTGHVIEVDIQEGLPMIRIDFSLMEQALLNLVYNAANHTQPGSRISVGARISGNELILSVSDDGPGLDEGEIPFIFEKFRRGISSPAGGTGLGLSICRGIVEAHHGTINASNRTGGHGAEFIIGLPLKC